METNHFFTNTKKKYFNNKNWFLNSGCTNHMTKRREILSYIDHFFSSSIKHGDKKILEVISMGDMEVSTKRGNMNVSGIYYALDLNHSRLSVGKMLEMKYKLVFEDNICNI